MLKAFWVSDISHPVLINGDETDDIVLFFDHDQYREFYDSDKRREDVVWGTEISPHNASD